MAQTSFWKDLLTSAPDYFDARFGKGATEAEISAVEKKFSLVLPPSYRAFLLEVGWAEVDTDDGGFAIAGLGSDVPEDLSLAEVILAARSAKIPEAFLPVVDAVDGQLFLDISTPEGAVILLEENNKKELLAASFGEWLTEELSE